MPDPRLVPGRHKRKNAKQILASLRAVAARAGLGWEEQHETSSRGHARVTRGDALVLAIRFEFGTTEIRFTLLPEGGTPVEVEAIYTDTELVLTTLGELLGV